MTCYSMLVVPISDHDLKGCEFSARPGTVEATPLPSAHTMPDSRTPLKFNTVVHFDGRAISVISIFDLTSWTKYFDLCN